MAQPEPDMLSGVRKEHSTPWQEAIYPLDGGIAKRNTVSNGNRRAGLLFVVVVNEQKAR